MAEVAALGLAASILQIADLGLRVVRRIADFQSTVQELPKSLQSTSLQIPLLQDALSRLEQYAHLAERDDAATSLVLLPVIRACHNELRSLEAILAKVSPHKHDKAWKRASKALFSVAQDRRVLQINANLERYMQSLTLYQVSRFPFAYQRPFAINSTPLQVMEGEHTPEPADDATSEQDEEPKATDVMELPTSTSSPPQIIGSKHDVFIPVMDLEQSQCDPWCACSCHWEKSFQSPAALERFIGRLRLTCSGLYWVNQCDIPGSCRTDRRFSQVVGSYALPAWFVNVGVSFFLQSQALGAVTIGLQPMRPVGAVDAYPRVFYSVARGELKEVQQLFSMGLASPFDYYAPENCSILEVC